MDVNVMSGKNLNQPKLTHGCWLAGQEFRPHLPMVHTTNNVVNNVRWVIASETTMRIQASQSAPLPAQL